MKTYTLTPEAQEAFDEWYSTPGSPSIAGLGFTAVMESFYFQHPEHLAEAPSTSKRDEVLMVAGMLAAGRMAVGSFSFHDHSYYVDHAIKLQAEVDKRFNTTHP